jgi:hypothetical protein
MLKVKDWLKLRKPDHSGFLEHIEKLKELGIQYNFQDILTLAKNYGLIEPTINDGKVSFNITANPVKIHHNITIKNLGS